MTTSNFRGAGESEVDTDDVPGEEGGEYDKEDRFSRSVFSYRKRPDWRWEYNVGSFRACEEAILISVVDGSMASIEDALVGVNDEDDDVERGIVRASDSAKIPPPQPISKYLSPVSPSLLLVLLSLMSSVEAVTGLSEVCDCDLGPYDDCSERQELIKSCRSGFIR